MRAKIKQFFLLFVFLLIGIVYLPVLLQHPTLKLDDQDLLQPLYQVHSLSDYSNLVFKHQVLDIQPVRDLSFWVEIQIENWTGYRNSQLVNLVVWFLILSLSFAILSELFPNSPWNFLLILILAVHPVATTSVAWIAARKHLLSAFFILLCTWLALLDSKRPSQAKSLGILIFFALAVFSQPINLGWPLWLAFYFYQRGELVQKRRLGQLAGLTVLALSAAYLNYEYYSATGFSGEAPPKINPESLHNFVSRILVLGRYTFQIVIPVRPVGLPYRLQQFPSYLGLGYLSLLLLAQFKWRIFKDFKWVLFLVLPVGVMTAKLTHHAGYDTYILVTLIGFVFLLGSFLWRVELKAWSRWVAATVVLSLSAVSFAQAQKWTSDEKIFAQAYESEGTELATVGYAKLLLDERRLQEASQLINELGAGDPANREIPALKGRLFYLLDWPPAQKAEVFRKNEIFEPWYQYYYAAFEASDGQFERAHQRILKIWQLDPEKFKREFAGNEGILFSNWKKICQAAGPESCSEIEKIQEAIR